MLCNNQWSYTFQILYTFRKLGFWPTEKINTPVRALIKWLICFDLQDKTCCRLTLFNARRGGKPAQLHLSDWADSCNKVWFDMCDTEKFSRTVLLLLRELSLSDISWSFSVSMYFCVSGIFCVTERNKLSDINDNKHATWWQWWTNFVWLFRLVGDESVSYAWVRLPFFSTGTLRWPPR